MTTNPNIVQADLPLRYQIGVSREMLKLEPKPVENAPSPPPRMLPLAGLKQKYPLG